MYVFNKSLNSLLIIEETRTLLHQTQKKKILRQIIFTKKYKIRKKKHKSIKLQKFSLFIHNNPFEEDSIILP